MTKLTTGLEVLKRGPFYYAVLVLYDEELIKARVVIDKGLCHARWTYLLQAFFTKDKTHLETKEKKSKEGMK